MIILLEGVDGVGKTTLAHSLKERMEENGFSALVLREPGGTYWGEKIRELLNSSEKPRSRLSTLCLFLASRAELLETIKREKGNYNYIIIDRFTPSTLAYQTRSNEEMRQYLDIDRAIRQDFKPDVTFYLTAPYNVCQERLKSRGEDMSFSEYDALTRRYTKAFNMLEWKTYVINGDNDVEKEVKQIVTITTTIQEH